MNTDDLEKIEVIPLMDTLRLQKIDDAEYFSAKFGGYISNSRLSLINPLQDNDPKAFFEGLSKHNKYSDALIFGSAVHELTLQPELFHLCTTVDRPTAKAGFMADELYKTMIGAKSKEEVMQALDVASDKVDYYKGKFDLDKKKALIEKCSKYWKDRHDYEASIKANSEPIYLDPKNRERLAGCIQALNNDTAIQNLLHPKGLFEDPISENEQAILLDVQVKVPNYDPFILRIKAKLDNYTIDTETNTLTVNDVKTIGKIVAEFPNNFERFHYYRELSLYSWLLTLVARKYYGMERCTVKSNCLIVSTIPNYNTGVYELTKRDFYKGWREFTLLLKLVARYYSKGYRFE